MMLCIVFKGKKGRSSIARCMFLGPTIFRIISPAIFPSHVDGTLQLIDS